MGKYMKGLAVIESKKIDSEKIFIESNLVVLYL
jgi:hypothetical protein